METNEETYYKEPDLKLGLILDNGLLVAASSSTQ